MSYRKVVPRKTYYALQITDTNLDEVMDFIERFSCHYSPDFDALDENKQIGWLYESSGIRTLSLRIGSYVVVDTDMSIRVLTEQAFKAQFKFVQGGV